MKPILIIKTGNTISSLPASAGDFEHWIIRGMGLREDQARTVAVFTGDKLPDPRAVAGVVITGSAAMVTDREDWSEQSAAYVRDLVSTEVPLLGICYGHQLIAHALGGEVGWNPRGREIGTWDIELREAARGDPLFGALPARFPAHTTHSQSVLRLPEGAELLASSALDPIHALRFAPKAWSVQFHPEFQASVMRAYILERYDDLARESLAPDELLNQVRETDEAESLLRTFARLAGF